MSRLAVAVALVALVALVAAVLRRRRGTEAPTQPGHWRVPAQLDRRDFARPDVPWLVVVFSSAGCGTCEAVVAKATVLASAQVAVQEVEYRSERALHDRYHIDAVPTTLVVDAAGVVRQSFLGPVTATDLWAAVATARDPGAGPGPCASDEP